MIDPKATKLDRECKHTRPLLAVRFDPTGRYLFAASEDFTIQRFELEWGKCVPFTGHQSWVRALGFGANSTFVSGDYHGRLLYWSMNAPTKPIREIEAHTGWIRALTVSPDGQTIATCGNDAMVRLWSIADGKLIRELRGHDCHVYNVAFHPNGQRLASADLKGIVREWDIAKGEQVREMEAKSILVKYDPTFKADIGGVRSMAFNADGSLLACAGITNVSNAFAGIGNPVVVLFDWNAGKVKQQLKPAAAFQGTAWGVGFHKDGFVIGAGGGNGGQAWFWKPEEANSFHMMAMPQSARDMALHPDGVRFAVAGADGVARVYSMAKG